VSKRNAVHCIASAKQVMDLASSLAQRAGTDHDDLRSCLTTARDLIDAAPWNLDDATQEDM
jgi:hypothetical protein